MKKTTKKPNVQAEDTLQFEMCVKFDILIYRITQGTYYINPKEDKTPLLTHITKIDEPHCEFCNVKDSHSYLKELEACTRWTDCVCCLPHLLEMFFISFQGGFPAGDIEQKLLFWQCFVLFYLTTHLQICINRAKLLDIKKQWQI